MSRPTDIWLDHKSWDLACLGIYGWEDALRDEIREKTFTNPQPKVGQPNEARIPVDAVEKFLKIRVRFDTDTDTSFYGMSDEHYQRGLDQL